MDSSVPHIDLTVSASSFQEGAKTILKKIRPSWSNESIKFKVGFLIIYDVSILTILTLELFLS